MALAAANTPGDRNGVSVMLISIRILLVRAAIHGSSGQPWNHLPLAATGNCFGNSVIIPKEGTSSPRSEASGTTTRSSVQTESKSSSSARSVRSVAPCGLPLPHEK